MTQHNAQVSFWMDETSGVLIPAVTAYLKRESVTPEQVLAIRAYLRQWMRGDFRGEGVEQLRAAIDNISTVTDIDRWCGQALGCGIDPF